MKPSLGVVLILFMAAQGLSAGTITLGDPLGQASLFSRDWGSPWLTLTPTEVQGTELRTLVVNLVAEQANESWPRDIRATLLDGEDSIVVRMAKRGEEWDLLSWDWDRGRPITDFWQWRWETGFRSGKHQRDRQGQISGTTIVQGGKERRFLFFRQNGIIVESQEQWDGLTKVTTYDTQSRPLSSETHGQGGLQSLGWWWYGDGGLLEQSLDLGFGPLAKAILQTWDTQGYLVERRVLSAPARLDQGLGLKPRGEILAFVQGLALETRVVTVYDESGRVRSENTWDFGRRTLREFTYEPGATELTTTVQGERVSLSRTEGTQRTTTYFRRGQAYLRVTEVEGKKIREEDLAGTRVLRTRNF